MTDTLIGDAAAAQRHAHGERSASPEPTGSRATSTSFGRRDAIPEQSSVTAPDDTTDGPLGDDCVERHGLPSVDSYKNQARCMSIFDDMKGRLQTLFDQLQKTSSKSTEIQLLLQQDPNCSMATVARALDGSIFGVQRIIQGDVAVTKQLKSIRSLSVAQKSSTKAPIAEVILSGTQNDDLGGQPCHGCDELPGLSMDDSSDPSTDLEEASGTPENKRLDLWSISAPGADPFVHAPQKGGYRASPNALQLNFHLDFTELPGPKLYRPFPPTGRLPQLQSRRTILGNLPPDATIAQAVKGVRCYGGIVGISMLNTAPFFGGNTKSALLEFVYPKSAADYVKAHRACHLIYEANNGDKYRAAAWLIPSPSYAFSSYDRKLLEKGQTRALLLRRFPRKGAWYFLSAVGCSNIVYARYSNDADELMIELATLAHAAKVERLIRRGMFRDIHYAVPGDSITCSIINDSSQAPASDFKAETGFIRHVSPHVLAEEWNRQPFNEYWPTQREPVMQLQGLSPRAVPSPRPSSLQRLAAQYEIEEDEVDDYLEERQSYQDTAFRILGSTITLTRRKWGWSITDEDETKLLMANTLHEPGWADEWDHHFRARGQVNLRTWEQYGMLAKHRREKAAEQGIEPGKVPNCKGCGKGCGDIKSAPVPELVREYLDLAMCRILDAE